MKNFLKVSVLILALTMALGVLVGCGGSSDDSWKPSGADITIASKTSPMSAIVLFGDPADLSRDAANIFKKAINETKLAVINSVFSSAIMSEESEILFGTTDRTASVKAKELYDKEKSGLYSWAFYYYDGKLAIYAESATAYELAVNDFIKSYVKGDAIVIKDTLAECHSITEAEYEKHLEEIDNAIAEERKKKNEKYVAGLIEDIKDQRNDLADIAIFNNATADLLALVGNHSWGTAPATPIDEHPRVMFTKDDIPGIRKALRDDTATNAYFFELLDTHFDGILTNPGEYTPGENCHNYKGTDLEKMMVKALAYQLYDDPYYGYQAIYAAKNYLKTMKFVYISSDQYRQFGDVGFAIACVYDWCYDLLTEDDKRQIIAATENQVFKGYNEKGEKFEVGFPPTKQSSFVGHGAEYQLLRDYLSFSIAIYDENPSWYAYIGARFFNDFVPTRNCYFEPTGLAPQGTSYLTLRHNATLYSAWLAVSGLGVNPYINLHQTINSFSGYEYSPGYIFTDGDGAGVQKTSNLRTAQFLTGYLYDDPTLIALGEISLDGGEIQHETQGIGCAIYSIIRGKCVKPEADPYSTMDLVQYNGSPLGQYIVRESWQTADSAAVFMKLKERHTANHEHGDSGSFQIFYKSMLSSEGGVYDNYNHEHTQKFYKTSVSHNTLLIKNHKIYDAYNIGSQKTFTTPLSPEHWLSDTFVAGTITGREHGYFDGTKTPEYAYIGGDITKSYHDTTAYYVGRRMLTVYTGDEDFPMAFFVYDDISAKNVAFKKTFLLQITSPDEPTINTKKQTVITENGDGRLVLTCHTKGVEIEGIGGRVYKNGVYDPINSKNYLLNGTQMVTLNKKDDGHWGRIEISLSGAVDHTFMNVIYVTDKGQKKDAPDIKYIKSEGVEGSTFGGVAAVFMTSRERLATEISFEVEGKGDMKYYVSGVTAGEWNISVNGKSCGKASATEEGGLLIFTAPVGEVTLTPSK